MERPKSDRVLELECILEAAISDALANLPRDTSADKVAEWLLANRWQSFPDSVKNHFVHMSLRRAFCSWAGRQMAYYARLSERYPPPDEVPF